MTGSIQTLSYKQHKWYIELIFQKSNYPKFQTAEASLIHMYWSSPRLSMYWTEIFQTLSQVFSTELDPNPLAAIFGVIVGSGAARVAASYSSSYSH